MSSAGPDCDLVIVVPYRNRRRYLDIFVKRVPRYVESQGIDNFRICVAEQAPGDTFNLALSRNVGALYAIHAFRPKYLIFQDVDVIPIRGVDYRPEPTNLTWFLSAGSSKVRTDDFITVNGYNPAFLGWGSEDSEFDLRLISFGRSVAEWKRRPASADAMILSLEHLAMSREAAASLSQSYWGGPPTPQFITHNDPEFGVPLDHQYDKRVDFHNEERRRKNLRLYEAAWQLPLGLRRNYFASTGLNLVMLDRLLDVREDGRISHVAYDPRRVLERNPLSITEFNERLAG